MKSSSTPKVNKQVIVDFIVSRLEKGDRRSEILAKVGEKWQENKFSPRTFDRMLKTANGIQKERQEKATKAADAVYIETKSDAVKNGLKSKLEKQLHIQKEIEGIQSDIDRGILEDYVIISGRVQMVNKKMNAESKAYLRKVIKELYAELNKMEGDYAPTKIAPTDKDGNDVPQIFKVEIVPSKDE